MKIHLATALLDAPHAATAHFEALQRQDRLGVHTLTSDAQEADVILFADPHLHAHRGDWRIRAVRSHPLARAFPRKTLVFDERDDPWPDLPGIYLSLPAPLFDIQRHRAYGYPVLMNELVEDAPRSTKKPELLFSFVGTRTHPIRRDLLELKHPRGLVEENTVNMFAVSNHDIQSRKQRFAQILDQSKFVLCPRGMGTSSIRLFETMRVGRVPVIISDHWVAPQGPAWNLFSIRVPERHIASIPARLEEEQARWEEMSRMARAAYDEWFSPGVMFHRVGNLCAEILASLETAPPRVPHASHLAKFCARHLAIRARVKVGASRARLKQALRRS